MLPDTASGQIAIETGIRGSNMCIVTACSTGTHNIGEAAEGIRRGDFIAAHRRLHREPAARGGLHRLHQHAWHGHAAAGRADRRPSRGRSTGRATASCSARAPARWCSRTSSSPRRAARKVYAEVVGYGSAADAWDLIQPIEKGDGTRRAMEQALERHGVPADEVDLINPHGTSTPLGDLREAQAIWVGVRRPHAGDRDLGTKSMTGHLMGAAGAVEGVFTVLSVYNQCAPATLNYRDADPEINLNVVHGGSRPMQIRYAMSATTSAWVATTARSSSSATTATDRHADRRFVAIRRPIRPERLR